MEEKQQNDRRIRTMAEAPPVLAVLKMGIPVTLGMLFMVVYNLTDTYFIGRLNDDCQLAATHLSYPVLMLLIAFAGIVGNGGASYIARCIGAGRMEEANHTLTLGFGLTAVCGGVFSVLGMALLDPIVRLLGADAETFAPTRDYVMVLLLGAVLTMGNYAAGQLLRAEGSTGYSMLGMIAGNLLNMVLDPLFIFTMGLGVKGAAVATVIGNGAGMCISLLFYTARKTLLTPSLRYLRPDKTILREIFLVGTPHTLEQLFSTAAIVVTNNLVKAYSPATVAAMGISNKLMSFGNYVYQGMAAGSQPLIGYNYGARNFGRMRKLFGAGVAVITCCELAVMALYGLGAPWLVGFFTEKPAIIACGARTLRAAMLMLPFVGTTSLARNAFNSMGKPMFAFGITVVRQLVLYIPFVLLFDRLWGYSGLIFAQPAEEALCMLLAAWLLLRQIKRFNAVSPMD